jgi:hypothetical protein
MYLSRRSVPFAGVDDAGGDAQNSMDERDLDVPVTLGAAVRRGSFSLDPWTG